MTKNIGSVEIKFSGLSVLEFVGGSGKDRQSLGAPTDKFIK